MAGLFISIRTHTFTRGQFETSPADNEIGVFIVSFSLIGDLDVLNADQYDGILQYSTIKG